MTQLAESGEALLDAAPAGGQHPEHEVLIWLAEPGEGVGSDHAGGLNGAVDRLWVLMRIGVVEAILRQRAGVVHGGEDLLHIEVAEA